MTALFKSPNALAIARGKSGRQRDPRLDFFRGLGMFIILIAHIPGNSWALWIPARFGFSDATEIFVCLSGMASALAFGRIFDEQGYLHGTSRVIRRVWQIYWIHVLVFIVLAALMVAADQRPNSSQSYIDLLNLTPFFRDSGNLLVHYLTLTYVPNYFDILPMYLVILAMLPIMIAAERIHVFAPFVLSIGLWIAAQFHLLGLPAEPWSNRRWFFNPFGWQLIFFTGFYLMRSKLPAPRFSTTAICVAFLIVLAAVPLSYFRIHFAFPGIAEAAREIGPLTSKTNFGILRFIHFLAIAYLATHLAGTHGSRLRGRCVKIVSKVGQQTLAVFVSGLVAARLLGIFLDYFGRGSLQTFAVNAAGIALLIAAAYFMAWFKQLQTARPAAPVFAR